MELGFAPNLEVRVLQRHWLDALASHRVKHVGHIVALLMSKKGDCLSAHFLMDKKGG